MKENLPMQKGYIGGMALKQSKNKETKKQKNVKLKKNDMKLFKFWYLLKHESLVIWYPR